MTPKQGDKVETDEQSGPSDWATTKERADGLQRIEQQIAMILERINTLPSSLQNSPQEAKSTIPAPVLPVIVPTDEERFVPGQSGASLGSNADTDTLVWKRKRGSALPPLPLQRSVSPATTVIDHPEAEERRQATHSPTPSTEASSGHIRHERANAAARLEGQHGSQRQGQSSGQRAGYADTGAQQHISMHIGMAGHPQWYTQPNMQSAWSEDTIKRPAPDRMPSKVREV